MLLKCFNVMGAVPKAAQGNNTSHRIILFRVLDGKNQSLPDNILMNGFTCEFFEILIQFGLPSVHVGGQVGDGELLVQMLVYVRRTY